MKNELNINNHNFIIINDNRDNQFNFYKCKNCDLCVFCYKQNYKNSELIITTHGEIKNMHDDEFKCEDYLIKSIIE